MRLPFPVISMTDIGVIANIVLAHNMAYISGDDDLVFVYAAQVKSLLQVYLDQGFSDKHIINMCELFYGQATAETITRHMPGRPTIDTIEVNYCLN